MTRNPCFLLAAALALALFFTGCHNRGASALYYGTGGSDRKVYHAPIGGREQTLFCAVVHESFAFEPCREELLIGFNHISGWPLDGSASRIVTRQYQIGQMALDSKRGHLYWVNHRRGDVLRSIERSDLDGNHQTTVVDGIPYGHGLAVDAKHGKLYWTQGYSSPSHGPRGIWRANLDGSSREPIVRTDITEHVVVDARSRQIFWENIGRNQTSEIWSAGLDGSNPRALVTGLFWEIEDLEIDTQARKLYWAERQSGTAPDRKSRIQCCHFDGSGVEVLREVESRTLTYGALALGFAPGEKSWSRTLARCGCPPGKGR